MNRSAVAATRIARSLAVGGVLALLLAACTDGTDEPDASPGGPTPTPTESATPSPSPSEEPGTEQDVTAYFTVDSRAGLRLVRETQQVVAPDALVGAVQAMIEGPVDPDYATTWAPGTEVLSVTQEPDLITVDLSEEVRTTVAGSEGSALMIQQLVWTVTDAAGSPETPVLLTVEGEPAGELWGVVTWDEPVARAPAMDVRLLVQIDEPVEGAVVGSPLTVRGEAAVFEATVQWQVLDASGAPVLSGFTMTTEGQTFAPYSFDVELEPGTWTVVVVEDDPSGGEGGTPMSDSRTVTVE